VRSAGEQKSCTSKRRSQTHTHTHRKLRVVARAVIAVNGRLIRLKANATAIARARKIGVSRRLRILTATAGARDCRPVVKLGRLASHHRLRDRVGAVDSAIGKGALGAGILFCAIARCCSGRRSSNRLMDLKIAEEEDEVCWWWWRTLMVSFYKSLIAELGA